MDITKCFVCHVKTDDWRNDLNGLKSQHSCTLVTDFIKNILGEFNLMRNINDESNCICTDCLNRFEEYDWTCTMAKQYEKELYDLLVKTDELCRSAPKEDAVVIDVDAETKVAKTFGDPLTDFPTGQPVRNDEVEGEEVLIKVMVEPLDVLIPKYKQSDDEEPTNNEELDIGAIETQADDPDFDCKAEDDDFSFNDIEDDEYVPPKRKIKTNKVKKPKPMVNVKEEEGETTVPKKRGRKPKNREEQDEPKPRKKREKKSYECKDCEKVFEKLVDFVVRTYFSIKLNKICELKLVIIT